MLGGSDPAAAGNQLAKIMGEAFDDKYFFWDEEKQEEAKACKLKVANAVRFIMDSSDPVMSGAFKAACSNVLSEDQRKNVENAY